MRLNKLAVAFASVVVCGILILSGCKSSDYGGSYPAPPEASGQSSQQNTPPPPAPPTPPPPSRD